MALAQLYDHHGIEPGSGTGSGVGVGVGEISLPDPQQQHQHHHQQQSQGHGREGDSNSNNNSNNNDKQRRQDFSCERRVRLYKYVAEVGPWLDDVYYGPREAVREYR